MSGAATSANGGPDPRPRRGTSPSGGSVPKHPSRHRTDTDRPSRSDQATKSFRQNVINAAIPPSVA